jgi:hypothetical protein
MLSALKVLASGPGFVGITLTELNPHNAASDEWLLDRFAARFAEAVSRLSWLPLTEASLGIGPEKPVGTGGFELLYRDGAVASNSAKVPARPAVTH